ncbi:hypothetical protein COO60DRAFT_1212191 [Scenedesmus sp. NREL 46B-D3]|nr:hypothetical protein COO60DRAFT_1212191 [Scenedesmus sp. NREL 46B-D3]
MCVAVSLSLCLCSAVLQVAAAMQLQGQRGPAASPTHHTTPQHQRCQLTKLSSRSRSLGWVEDACASWPAPAAAQPAEWPLPDAHLLLESPGAAAGVGAGWCVTGLRAAGSHGRLQQAQ